MNFLDKIRNKPEHDKKIILWSIIAVTGVIFIVLWIYICSKNFSDLKNSNVLEEINLPSKEDLPDTEILPEAQEDLDKIEQMLRENNE